MVSVSTTLLILFYLSSLYIYCIIIYYYYYYYYYRYPKNGFTLLFLTGKLIVEISGGCAFACRAIANVLRSLPTFAFMTYMESLLLDSVTQNEERTTSII